MIKRISVTLTEEDVDAALIAYVAQKYGTLRSAVVKMKIVVVGPQDFKFVEAEVSGDAN
jgi:hypothetical protein